MLLASLLKLRGYILEKTPSFKVQSIFCHTKHAVLFKAPNVSFKYPLYVIIIYANANLMLNIKKPSLLCALSGSIKLPKRNLL